MPATAKTSKAQPTIVSMFKKGAVAAPVVRVVEPNKGDTHYDLWSSGKYKSIPDGPTPRLASLHLFLVAEGTVRGFKNHQNDTNKVLKLWLKEFDRAKLADDDREGSKRKTILTIVAEAHEFAMNEAEKGGDSDASAVSVQSQVSQGKKVKKRVVMMAPQVSAVKYVDSTSEEEEEEQCVPVRRNAASEQPEAAMEIDDVDEYSSDGDVVFLGPTHSNTNNPNLTNTTTAPANTDSTNTLKRKREAQEKGCMGLRESTVQGHLNRFSPWLVVGEDKFKCLYCGAFSHAKTKLARDLPAHAGDPKHQRLVKAAALQASNGTVLHTLHANSDKEVEFNQKMLKICIEVIVFLARKGVGHSNLEEFLSFFADKLECTDMEAYLRQQIRYLSCGAVLEIMSCITEVLTEDLLKQVKASRFWGLSGDCSRDVSKKEQLVFVVRYMVGATPVEKLIMMGELKDQTGAGYASLLTKWIDQLGLDYGKMSGCSFDGASAMRSSNKGCQQQIRADINPGALFTWCYAHSLALCGPEAAAEGKSPEITRFFDGLRWVWVFFSGSKIKLDTLEEMLEELRDLCEYCDILIAKPGDTRWLTNGRCCSTVRKEYPAVHSALCKLGEAGDVEAPFIAQHIKEPGFFATLSFMTVVLDVLSTSLQSRNTNLLTVCSHIDKCVASLSLLETNPNMFPFYPEWVPRYNQCHGTKLSRRNFAIHHDTVCKPYLKELLKCLSERFVNMDIVRCFSVFDIRNLPANADGLAIYGNTEVKKLIEEFTELHTLEYKKYDVVGEKTRGRPEYSKTEHTVISRTQTTPLLSVDTTPFVEESPELNSLETKKAVAVKEWRILVDVLSKRTTTKDTSDLIATFLTSSAGDAYPIMRDLVLLGLSIPVTSVEDERCFNGMKYVKNSYRNKLLDSSLLCILMCKQAETNENKFTPDQIQRIFEAFKRKKVRVSV